MYAWIITTYSNKSTQAIVASIPKDEKYFIYNGDAVKSVAQLWNNAIRNHLKDYDALIITQEDVVVEENTGIILVDELKNWDMTMAWDKDRISTMAHPNAYCFTVTPRLIKEVGYFDEGFEKYLLEDIDYFYRMKVKKLVPMNVTPVTHHGGISTRKLTPAEHEIWTQNYVRYCIKWGGPIDEEQYTVAFNGLTEKEALEQYTV